jgi:hypothetical protein
MHKYCRNWKAVAKVAVAHGDITRVAEQDLFRDLRNYRRSKPERAVL